MGKKSKRKRKKYLKARDSAFTQESIPQKMCVFEKVSVWSIKLGVYAILFAPLIVSSGFFFPFVVPKSAVIRGLIAFVLGVYILLAFSHSRYRPKMNSLTAALFLFVGVYLTAAIFGIDFVRSFWGTFERMTGVLTWVHLALLFVVISSVFKTRSELKTLAGVAVIAGTIIASLFWLEYRFGIEIVKSSQMGSTLGNSSFLGAYLIFPVFLSVWLWVGKGEFWKRLFFGVCFLIMAGAVFFATSYGAMVAMVGGFFLLFVLLLFVRGPKIFRFAAIILFATELIAAPLIFWGAFTENERVLRFLPSFVSEGAIGTRRATWNNAWQGFKERPFLGWGPENFNVVFTKNFNPCMPLPECAGEVWYDKAHNIVLDTINDAGVAGVLSYALLYLVPLWFLWFRFIKKPSRATETSSHDLEEQDRFLLPPLFTALFASYLVQNLLVFDMISTQLMLVVTFAIIGSFMNQRKEVSSAKVHSVTSSTCAHFLVVPAMPLFIIPLFMLFTGSIQPLRASWYTNMAVSVPFDKALPYFEKALSLTPMSRSEIPEKIGEFFSVVARNGALNPNDFRKAFGLAERELQKNADRNPLDFRARLLLGQLYISNFLVTKDSVNLENAEKVLKEAISLSPTNQLGYWALANVKRAQGDMKAVGDLLKKALDLEPRFGRAQYLYASYQREILEFYLQRNPDDADTWARLSQVYKAIGEKELARNAAKKVAELKPEYASYAKEFIDSLEE